MLVKNLAKYYVPTWLVLARYISVGNMITCYEWHSSIQLQLA
jgi:hypothetical protein